MCYLVEDGGQIPFIGGLRFRRCVPGTLPSLTSSHLNPANTPTAAQTDIKDPSAEPSADDFLAREKAILGDDADQFATNQDTAALSGGDDLLGGGDDAQFQSQFPDITSPNEVWNLTSDPY